MLGSFEKAPDLTRQGVRRPEDQVDHKVVDEIGTGASPNKLTGDRRRCHRVSPPYRLSAENDSCRSDCTLRYHRSTTIAELNKNKAYKAHKDIHDRVDRVEIGHGITSIDDVLASGAVFLSDGNFVIQLYSRNSHMQTLTTEGNTFEHILTSDLAVVCGGRTTRTTAVASLRKVIEMMEQLSDEEFKPPQIASEQVGN